MQGFNMGRYVPPDAEGVSSGNQIHRKHPLGARGRNAASTGAIVVRFEMPFNVWCANCPRETLIGQGVRFNAEKRKVGAYYSSSIWAFRMRHTDCGGTLEIRTDPQNTAYVVVEGGRRQDRGDLNGPAPDALNLVHESDDVAAAEATSQTREELRQTAFGRLEKTIVDRGEVARATERLDELQDAAERAWDDPYMRNQQLRSVFRAGRKEREREAMEAQDLKDRLSLGAGIELLAGSREDELYASLVDFGYDDADAARIVEREAMAKPMFGGGKAEAETEAGRRKGRGVLKAEALATARKSAFVSQVVGNTRLSQDPFLAKRTDDPQRSSGIAGIKRKRVGENGEPSKPGGEQAGAGDAAESRIKAPKAALVNYDSSGSE
ncbi:Protein saf4 [Ceratocystis pirilliformis]|uniref:Protein saf4 n=1 Tax=Ceratocystis pirilliformis TaxID=259994 RepID=A0ABR3YM86_9PEZI